MKILINLIIFALIAGCTDKESKRSVASEEFVENCYVKLTCKGRIEKYGPNDSGYIVLLYDEYEDLNQELYLPYGSREKPFPKIHNLRPKYKDLLFEFDKACNKERHSRTVLHPDPSKTWESDKKDLYVAVTKTCLNECSNLERPCATDKDCCNELKCNIRTYKCEEGSNLIPEKTDFKFNVYPNPSRDNINIQISLPTREENIVVRIFDISGREKTYKNIDSIDSEDTVTMNVANFAVGIYIFVLEIDGKKEATFKFQKI